MRVLLTGAAGFIGSRVDAALRAAGHDVVGVDALLPAAHGPNPVLPPGCQRVDVRDASTKRRTPAANICASSTVVAKSLWPP